MAPHTRIRMETTRQILRVDPREIAYLRMTIESYDGMAVVRTLDPQEALIEIQVAPGCENLISALVTELKEKETIDINPEPVPGTKENRGAYSLGRYYHIVTMGCQMNEYDSDYMAQCLQHLQLLPTKDPKQADIILINTCTVREKAEQKAYSLLGRMLGLKKKRPGKIVGVTGCVAQQQGKDLLRRFPELDLVLGPREIAKIQEGVRQAALKRKKFVATSIGPEPPCAPARRGYFEGHVKGYVSIMEGCNNFCTYCVVPYVRGRETSRAPGQIVKEVENLLSQGVKEVTLLGQNVNSYFYQQDNGYTFARLLKTLDTLDGIKRIRFTTSHPKDLSNDLIACFGSLKHLCPHIHLPFQAGSNKVLKAMHRGYTREKYLELIRKLRSVKPGIAITSDVMVGFPGETDQDFEETLDLVKTVEFDSLFSFRYSDRKGTAAEKLPEKIPEPVKASRLSKLQNIQKAITLKKNRALVGAITPILVEGVSKRKGGQLTGRTDTNKIVNFCGDPKMIGHLVKVLIKEAFTNSLRGEAVKC